MGIGDSGSGLRSAAMSSDSEELEKGRRWALGVFLLLLGAGAIALSGMMKVSGFTDSHDPGPAALPRLAGGVLAIGGLVEIVHYFVRRRSQQGAGATSLDAVKSGVTILVQVIAYVALLPLLGFSLATCAFTTALLRWFGAGWKMSAGVSVALVLVINILFSQVFEVILPSGRLGLPF